MNKIRGPIVKSGILCGLDTTGLSNRFKQTLRMVARHTGRLRTFTKQDAVKAFDDNILGVKDSKEFALFVGKEKEHIKRVNKAKQLKTHSKEMIEQQQIDKRIDYLIKRGYTVTKSGVVK